MCAPFLTPESEVESHPIPEFKQAKTGIQNIDKKYGNRVSDSANWLETALNNEVNYSSLATYTSAASLKQ